MADVNKGRRLQLLGRTRPVTGPTIECQRGENKEQSTREDGSVMGRVLGLIGVAAKGYSSEARVCSSLRYVESELIDLGDASRCTTKSPEDPNRNSSNIRERMHDPTWRGGQGILLGNVTPGRPLLP